MGNYRLYAHKPPMTRAARRAPPPVQGFTQKIVADLARSTGYASPELVARWPELAGDELRSICTPGKISHGARHRTLDVHVSNGGAATRVNFLSGILIERLNAFLGPDIVTQIKVIQSGGDAPSPEGGSPRGLGRFRAG